LDQTVTSDLQDVNTAARRVARQALDPEVAANKQAKNTLAHKTAYKAHKSPGALFLFETDESSSSSEGEKSSDSDSSSSSDSSIDEPTRNNPKRRKAPTRRRERKRARSAAGLPEYILDNTGLLSQEEMQRLIDSCELTSLTSERAEEILKSCHESLTRKFQRKSICSVCDQQKSTNTLHIQRFPNETHADIDTSSSSSPVSPMDMSSPESSIDLHALYQMPDARPARSTTNSSPSSNSASPASGPGPENDVLSQIDLIS
jgi:hypothetical protein